MEYRIGYGYDLHQFAEDRPCVIGGIVIPFEKGLKGHSDADVLLHAIADALLGSLALGDLGKFFPDTDPEWKDADSSELLRQVNEMINVRGWMVQNLDVTVITEEPKLSPFIDEIRKSVSGIVKIDVDRVSIKATTSEKIGFIGRGEGIAVHATVLVKSEK